MKSSTVLRWCVILEMAVTLAAIFVAFVPDFALPEPLSIWQDAQTEVSVGDFIFLFLYVQLIIPWLVAVIGLLFLRRWAAWLYLIIFFLTTLCGPFTGPTVEHALVTSLSHVASVFSGMVIALAFFTDSLKRGNRAELCSEQTV